MVLQLLHLHLLHNILQHAVVQSVEDSGVTYYSTLVVQDLAGARESLVQANKLNLSSTLKICTWVLQGRGQMMITMLLLLLLQQLEVDQPTTLTDLLVQLHQGGLSLQFCYEIHLQPDQVDSTLGSRLVTSL
jgi:hypothetical protein